MSFHFLRAHGVRIRVRVRGRVRLRAIEFQSARVRLAFGWLGWLQGLHSGWLSFGEGVRVPVRVIGLGLESGWSESSASSPTWSRSQGARAQQVRPADQARRVAQRACIARVIVCVRVRSGSVSGLQQVKCTGTAISFGERHHVGHAHGGHNPGDGARSY